MGVDAFLSEKSARVETALEACLRGCDLAPGGLIEAMRYSLMAGGKRLRPALALGACELVLGDDLPALPAACALEMVHTYSLIHDDLPAMDNDDLRRGRPTSHKRFDEATAILAGDALLTQAFVELARSGNVAAVGELAVAAGASGMVGGQYRDMQAQGRGLDLDGLQGMHAQKTGALITASLRLGAILGEASDIALEALTCYGRSLGLLFQITDDILDVVGDTMTMGKTVGKDRASEKATYPALVGVEGAREMARQAAQDACEALAVFGDDAGVLREMPVYILERRY